MNNFVKQTKKLVYRGKSNWTWSVYNWYSNSGRYFHILFNINVCSKILSKLLILDWRVKRTYISTYIHILGISCLILDRTSTPRTSTKMDIIYHYPEPNKCPNIYQDSMTQYICNTNLVYHGGGIKQNSIIKMTQ